MRETIAMGGQRTIPAPDPIARDYLLLALRLDQRSPGLVDGYFGPADLKAAVDMEQLRPAARLRDDAAALRARLPGEVPETDRRTWLEAQLVALETQAAVLAGETPPYEAHVERLFSIAPARRPESRFDHAAAELDDLLPGHEPLVARLAAWDARFEIPPDRLPALVDWLVERFRARSGVLFGLPEDESLTVGLVRDQPWTGYNWYEGGGRSRIDINLDLPMRAAQLLHVIAHETYPGHHLEHAWKEAELVDRQGRLESSVLLINTPECLVSEGLADLGRDFAVPPEEEVDLFVELYERAGLDVASDRQESLSAARRQAAMIRPRRRLDEARATVALLRHADDVSRDEALAYLIRFGRVPADVAAKRLEFIEHPLWRTYVFVYFEGEDLLRRWLAAVPPADRAARFNRLLREQLSPGTIQIETIAS
jgi:hypothetical protein